MAMLPEQSAKLTLSTGEEVYLLGRPEDGRFGLNESPESRVKSAITGKASTLLKVHTTEDVTSPYLYVNVYHVVKVEPLPRG